MTSVVLISQDILTFGPFLINPYEAGESQNYASTITGGLREPLTDVGFVCPEDGDIHHTLSDVLAVTGQVESEQRHPEESVSVFLPFSFHILIKAPFTKWNQQGVHSLKTELLRV